MTTTAVQSTPRSVSAMRGQVEILIVDDRPENLLALEAILEPLGQKVVRANSGEETLRMLLTHDVAVVLLDVQMPGMSGFETAQLIKSRERTRYIPIIFLTAISKEEDYVFRGYQVGAVDYISKPFQPDVLRAKVAVFVDLYLKQKRLAEQESLLRESERRELELRHMREMLQSEARFREIVETAMDAIVIFDDDERITLFNGAAERMFGRRSGDSTGHCIDELFPDAEGMKTIRALSAKVQTHGGNGNGATKKPGSGRKSDLAPQVASLRARRKNEEVFPAEATVARFEGPDGVQFTLIVRDVSERLRQEEELREQAVALERTMDELTGANDELNRRQTELEHAMTARSRFYASMSHELRTPINAVLGYSTLLLESIYGPLNEKQTEGIMRTQRAAKHLLELVNDVLDLSKIEAGKIDLRLQPMTLPGLIEELFVTVRPLADKHGTKLRVEHEGDPITLISDPRRVRQIVLNLLSNAIKFGKGKPIRVKVQRTAEGGASIAVIDEGEGIRTEDRERIFQEFVQLGKTQLQEGTGLGLPISRRLAEAMRGSLTLVSEPGKGSTFTLTLPASADEAPRLADQEQQLEPVDERRKPGESLASDASARPA
jgi:signal transduction histidine kinase/DNA-binding NarL/FixJ family response regulator